MQIGPYTLSNNLILAPMAGVTDQPFRTLCRTLGAGMVVSEMMTSNTKLWHTTKSQKRFIHKDEQEPRSVQIAGTEPEQMATAAQLNVAMGAQIIDINMGCPAKKVCKKAAGSALLQHPKLVAEILQATVNAVDVPVTLKIRTGQDQDHKNALHIAKIAEACGISALAIHGRTRACAFRGVAEYDTIKIVKQEVSIPIIANGDVLDEHSAYNILQHTQADGLMIGRAAQGNPWIFQQIDHYLNTETLLPKPSIAVQQKILNEHVKNLHKFYGELAGLRIARKHIGWYLSSLNFDGQYKAKIYKADTADSQIELINQFFAHIEPSFSSEENKVA